MALCSIVDLTFRMRSTIRHQFTIHRFLLDIQGMSESNLSNFYSVSLFRKHPHEPLTKIGFYVDRVTGGHSHHCDSDCSAGPGGAEGPRRGGAGAVWQQHETNRPCFAWLSRQQKGTAPWSRC